ncbi:MAG: glycosyl transferase [Actinobacteria bacterium]|nr:MAG: glycosyl transferase [Actinomycetota bacterium]
MSGRLAYVRAQLRRPPVELAVCAIFRNEAPYLAEWATFHRLVGVERFYLYDNRSADDWRAALAPELAEGVAKVIDWPHERGQLSAYADCLDRHRTDTRWIAFIDIDEFLFSPPGRSLPDVLRGFRTWPGVAVCSRYFGFGGWDEPPDGLVTESYLMRAPDDFEPNTWVKSIVFPRVTKAPADIPHHFLYRDARPAAGEDGAPVDGADRIPPTADLLRINHYYTRSRAEYARKLGMPSGWGGRAEHLRTDDPRLPPDDVRDESILRWVPILKRELSERPT